MRDRVRRLFSPIGTWATKLESWLALGAMISGWGFFTWLGNQWTDLAAYGWAAVMFFALGVTCIVVIVASIFLVALRYFHPSHAICYRLIHRRIRTTPASGAP